MNKNHLLFFLLSFTIFIPIGLEASDNDAFGININFAKEILDNDLKATIYYMPLTISTAITMTIDELINGNYYYKVVVNSPALDDNIDLLEKFNSVKLQKDLSAKRFEVRVYCEFESVNGKIFSFCLDPMLRVRINNITYNADLNFFYFIRAFVPQVKLLGTN